MTCEQGEGVGGGPLTTSDPLQNKGSWRRRFLGGLLNSNFLRIQEREIKETFLEERVIG